MPSVNRAILLGNVGKKPELKHTQNGKKYCYLSVATNEHWKDKTTGDKKEATVWHSVKLYERQAEFCVNHVGKGDKLYIEGAIKIDKYEKDGQEVTSYYILGQTIELLRKPLSASSDVSGGYTAERPPAPTYMDKNNDERMFGDSIPF